MTMRSTTTFLPQLFWSLVAIVACSVNAQVSPPVFAPPQILQPLVDKGTRLGIETTAAKMTAEKAGREPAAIKVESIPTDSPLRQINLEPGDFIFSVDWYYFNSADEMRRYIRSLEPGQVVDLMFWKAKDSKTYRAKLPMPGTPSSAPRCSVPDAVRQAIPNSMQDVLRKAESGSAVAQRMVGQYMEKSDEMRTITFKLEGHRPGTSNLDMSACWYRQAARNGDPDSQYEVGFMFDYGSRSVGGKNTFLAAYWYAKAANQGHLKALYKFGRKYIAGDGLPTDEERGKSLVLKAADGGDIDAMHYNFCKINIDWEYKRKIGC